MSTAKDAGVSHTETLGTFHYIGIVSAIVTGIVHLRLGIGFISSPLGVSFLFAGGVFLLASAGVAANVRRGLLYRLGIPFTLGQIVLWYGLNFAGAQKSFPADVGPLGAVDKLAQLLLIISLVYLIQQEQ